jgi:CAAX protease family protein
MSITIRALLIGRPVYVPHTPWGPIGALATVAVILLFCQFLLPWCLYYMSPDLYATASGYLGPPNFWLSNRSRTLDLLIQTTIIALVWLAAGMRGADRRVVLSLNRGKGGVVGILVIANLIWLVAFPTSFLLKELLGHGYEAIVPGPGLINDVWLKQYLPLISLISLIVAAPLAEEFLFRGFLLSAMAQSRIGFWGAVLFTNILWVSLHSAYPWHALSMTFVLGVLLSFAIWKSGSLWTCVLAHGLYNLEPALFQFIFVRN